MPVVNPMTMISLFPHMHLRGKAFQYDMIYPTGETKTMLKVDNWSLNWQLSYKLAKPIELQPGDEDQGHGVVGQFAQQPRESRSDRKT